MMTKNQSQEKLRPLCCKKCGKILLLGEIKKVEIKCPRCKHLNAYREK